MAEFHSDDTLCITAAAVNVFLAPSWPRASNLGVANLLSIESSLRVLLSAKIGTGKRKFGEVEECFVTILPLLLTFEEQLSTFDTANEQKYGWSHDSLVSLDTETDEAFCFDYADEARESRRICARHFRVVMLGRLRRSPYGKQGDEKVYVHVENLVVRIEADGHFPDGEEDNESQTEFFRNVLVTTTQTVIQHRSPHTTTIVTPYLCCAKHQKGSRGLIERADVIRLKRSEFEEWEVMNQRHLRRLAWFLNELRRITVEKTSQGAAVLVMTEKGAPLQIFEAKSSFGALPKEIVEQFWD